MGNVLFDFDLSSFGIRPDGFMPYVGGGAGYVWTDIKNARLNIGGSGYRLDDSDGNLAYQAILGAAWGLGGVVPGLSLTSEVRYFGTLSPTLNLERTSGPAQAGAPGSLKPDNNNLSVLLGLRYALLAPPPGARRRGGAASAAAAGHRRAQLPGVLRLEPRRSHRRARGRSSARPPQNARRASSTRIEVAGHADRSGTPQYNQRLSQRRAEVVASRTRGPRHRARGDRRDGLRREPAAGADAGRRARAAEPPRRDRAAVGRDHPACVRRRRAREGVVSLAR